jgi:hypothetical protein
MEIGLVQCFQPRGENDSAFDRCLHLNLVGEAGQFLSAQLLHAGGCDGIAAMARRDDMALDLFFQVDGAGHGPDLLGNVPKVAPGGIRRAAA